MEHTLQHPVVDLVTSRELSLAELTIIPKHILQLLPASESITLDSLNSALPHINTSPATIHVPIARLFSPIPPPPLDVELIAHSIPGESIQSAVRNNWCQFSSEGLQSVVYTPSGCSEQHYLFWIVTWWETVIAVMRVKKKQEDACTWLTHHIALETNLAAKATLHQARDYLGLLKWDSKLHFEDTDSNYTTVDLATYLSDQWLFTQHIDWMIECLHTKVEDNIEQAHTNIIHGPGLLKALEHFEGKPTASQEAPHFWQKLQKQVASGESPNIYCIANNKNIHWVALKVDFQHHVICYSNSMGQMYTSARA